MDKRVAVITSAANEMTSQRSRLTEIGWMIVMAAAIVASAMMKSTSEASSVSNVDELDTKLSVRGLVLT